jgi:hypothetical protein
MIVILIKLLIKFDTINFILKKRKVYSSLKY